MKKLINALAFFLVIAFTQKAFSQTADTIRLQNINSYYHVLNTTVNGKACRFLLDLGAGLTSVRPAFAEQNDIKSNSFVSTFNENGVRENLDASGSVLIQLGKTLITQKTLAIRELSLLNGSLTGKVDGVISLKSFEDRIISVNLSQNMIILEDEKSFKERMPRMIALDAMFATGTNGYELTAFINTQVAKHNLWMLLSNKNTDKIIISKSNARSLDLAPDSILRTKDYLVVRNQSYSFNPSVTEKLETAASDIIYDGMLNYSFLSDASFTLDLKRKLIFIEPE